MKSKDFGSFLEQFSEVLRDNGSSAAADGWASLATVFSIKPASKVIDVVKAFSAEPNGVGSGLSVGAILKGIPRLVRMLTPVSKPGLITDLEVLQTALKQWQTIPVADVVEAAITRLAAPVATKKAPVGPNEVVVTHHLTALERTLRDVSAFKLAFTALKNDGCARFPELKAIAKRFSGETAQSKAQALKFIWGHHSAIMESRDKDAATGGRTAA